MATDTTDSILQQVYVARIQINDIFKRAHELLAIREIQLFEQLDSIKEIYVQESISCQEELKGLELSKQSLKNLLRDNDTLDETLCTIERKIKRINDTSQAQASITFKWDVNFEKYLQNFGKISVNNNMETCEFVSIMQHDIVNYSNYENISEPVFSCCENKLDGKGPRELNHPKGLALEMCSGNIYLADQCNNRVQVFNTDGEYCFMFSEEMKYPWGICIHNELVYVSQLQNHCVNFYKLNGTFMIKLGSKGKNEGNFNSPMGVTVSNITRDLYVCDFNNHRVQIFNEINELVKMFGTGVLTYPRDVKLTTDLIIVLDKGNPCVHLFNISDPVLLNSIISKDKQIHQSLFFDIDKECNIIMTDLHSHCIKIFSMSGGLISQFGKEGKSVGEFISPTGVLMDTKGRIIVVCEKKENALQFF